MFLDMQSFDPRLMHGARFFSPCYHHEVKLVELNQDEREREKFFHILQHSLHLVTFVGSHNDYLKVVVSYK